MPHSKRGSSTGKTTSGHQHQPEEASESRAMGFMMLYLSMNLVPYTRGQLHHREGVNSLRMILLLLLKVSH